MSGGPPVTISQPPESNWAITPSTSHSRHSRSGGSSNNSHQKHPISPPFSVAEILIPNQCQRVYPLILPFKSNSNATKNLIYSMRNHGEFQLHNLQSHEKIPRSSNESVDEMMLGIPMFHAYTADTVSQALAGLSRQSGELHLLLRIFCRLENMSLQSLRVKIMFSVVPQVVS